MKKLLPALFLSLGPALLFAAPARADLYALIGDNGQVQFSREALDDRYQVFIKCEEPSPERLSTELKYIAPASQVEDHIIFKRVQKSPFVKKFEALVQAEARAQKLDPALVKAVIAVESAYDPAAVSEKGAVGLMQLIPGTAERYGIKEKAIGDPKTNISGGTRYLKDLIAMFNGDVPLALAGYNAGEGAVRQYKNQIPPYPETQQYVELVMQFYHYFSGRLHGEIKHLPGGRVRVTLKPRTDVAAITEQLCVAQLERDPRMRALFAPADPPAAAVPPAVAPDAPTAAAPGSLPAPALLLSNRPATPAAAARMEPAP